MTLTLDIPTLTTPRLRLCAPAAHHFDADAAFMATQGARFVGGPMTKELAWRSFASLIGHWALRGYGYWFAETTQGTPVGRVGLWFPEGWLEPEVSWTIYTGHQGQGFATEAATEVRRFAYEVLGWTTAISLIDPENEPSARLAQRLGCTQEGTFSHERYGDMNVWRHPGPDALEGDAP